MPRLKLWIILFTLWPMAVLGADSGPARSLGPGEILRGRFIEEHTLKGLGKPIQSEGRFLVAPERGLIWAVEKPLPATFIVTKGGMLQMIGGVPLLHQTSAKNPFLNHVTNLLAAALGRDWKKLESHVALTHSGDAKKWTVKMTPRPQSTLAMPFKAINAYGSKYVERAEVQRPDGVWDKYTFLEPAISSGPLTSMEENDFSFASRTITPATTPAPATTPQPTAQPAAQPGPQKTTIPTTTAIPAKNDKKKP